METELPCPWDPFWILFLALRRSLRTFFLFSRICFWLYVLGIVWGRDIEKGELLQKHQWPATSAIASMTQCLPYHQNTLQSEAVVDCKGVWHERLHLQSRWQECPKLGKASRPSLTTGGWDAEWYGRPPLFQTTLLQLVWGKHLSIHIGTAYPIPPHWALSSHN